MLDAIKSLVDSGLINEDAKKELHDSWNSKLNEARSEIKTQLREEFARRYEHDKSVMSEALDRMVTESLKEHVAQIVAEKKSLVEDRARFVGKMKETSTVFDKFMTETLSKELKELREDRSAQRLNIKKLEEFVINQLSAEISEFQKDRHDVVSTKVKLIKEAKEQFSSLKKKFIKKSSALVTETITKNLSRELKQLKEDISAAKENSFGRKIFESFAAEFSSSYLNENKELNKLIQKIKQKDSELTEAKKALNHKSKLVESKTQEIKTITEAVKRKEVMNSLVRTLNKDKAAIMRDLLESVQTDRLKSAFERYLPAVLDGKPSKKIDSNTKQPILESKKEITGDRQQKNSQYSNYDDDNIVELRRLAGLK